MAREKLTLVGVSVHGTGSGEVKSRLMDLAWSKGAKEVEGEKHPTDLAVTLPSRQAPGYMKGCTDENREGLRVTVATIDL